MKRLQAALCTLAIAAISIGSAVASDTNWRFNINVDDGNYSYSGSNMQIGVHSSATNGIDSYDAVAESNTSYTDQSLVAACTMSGSSEIWQRDIRAGDGSVSNTWDFRVAAMPKSDISTMRLFFSMLNNSTVQPPVDGIGYSLIMVNNQGVTNAPANGTVWDIAMPASYTSDYFFTLDLPVLKLTSANLMASNGYEFQLTQSAAGDPVPEPGTLVAMLSVISGLAGYGLTRRRTQA